MPEEKEPQPQQVPDPMPVAPATVTPTAVPVDPFTMIQELPPSTHLKSDPRLSEWRERRNEDPQQK